MPTLWACSDMDLAAEIEAKIAAVEQPQQRQYFMAADSRPWLRKRGVEMVGDLAVVSVVGVLIKWWGPMPYSLQGMATSNVETALTLDVLAMEPSIKRIVILIESPGGEAFGTYELAESLRKLSKRKKTVAFVDDCCASAAYWFASQARTVLSNVPGISGSIGVYSRLVDQFEFYQRMGLKVIPLRSAPVKGGAIPGAPVSEAVIQNAMERVIGFFRLFQAAVQQGRSLSNQQLATVSTGEVWGAHEAKKLRLIDGVATWEACLESIGGIRQSDLAALADVGAKKPLEPQPMSQETSYSPPERMGLLRPTSW